MTVMFWDRGPLNNARSVDATFHPGRRREMRDFPGGARQ
jgi:hypothetical protein